MQLLSSLQTEMRAVDIIPHLTAQRVTPDPASVSSSNHNISYCFVPFDRQNPYQAQLANALLGLGLERNPRSTLKGMIWNVWRGADAPTVIHLHWLPNFKPGLAAALRRFGFLLRLKVLRLMGVRIVWTVHNLYAHETKSRIVENAFIKRLLPNISQIIVHSPKARDLVTVEFNLANKEKIVVVPHGNYAGAYPNEISQREARKRLNLEQDTPVILFFGNIRPYKGVPELISAYQQIQILNSTLLIVGKPYNQDILTKIEASIQDTPRVRLIPGFVPEEDVQLYMNAADAVVFPYQDILTSGAVILAMSFGKACIAPSIGCIPDVLDDSGAFLYDPASTDGLCQALTSTLKHHGHLAEMGQYNFTKASQWTWDRVAKETALIYREAMNRSHAY